MCAKPVDNLIRDFVTQDISAAIQSFEITKKVEHKGLKGKAREIFVQKLFRSLLSNDFRLGSGTITDRYGKQARETDVILYCPEIMPARDPDAPAGYFPIEACIYTIEVKSTVTKAEISDAIKKGQALDQLEAVFNTMRGAVSTRPITVLFGFSSDLKSGPDEEFDRFRSLINEAGLSPLGIPPVRVFCVVEKGYWYFAPEVGGKQGHSWFSSGTMGKHPEVRALIAGIINTIRSEKLIRYGLPFGFYLLDDGPRIPHI
jgi:hypothetical protein